MSAPSSTSAHAAGHPNLPMVYNNMGEELRGARPTAEAMVQYRRAYDIWQSKLGPSFETTVAWTTWGRRS